MQMPQAGILGGVPAPQRSRPLFRQGGGPVPGAPMGAPPMGGPPMGGPPMGGPPMGGGMPPGMPGQQTAPMNPQLAGAIDLVDDDVEHLDLDPATEYALKVQEAADLLAGAKRELAMSQPQPQPSQVVPQLEQQITQAAQSGGFPEMAQRIQPGHQQLGINQQRRAQQALEGGQGRGGMPQLAGGPRGPGGVSQLPAPNMARPQMAAHGGIVGYEEGGDVDGGWWEIIKEADRKRTAQVHEEQQLRREQGRSIRDYIPFIEPKGQLWIENALYDASRGIGSLLNKRRPEAGATGAQQAAPITPEPKYGSAVLSETDTFRRATEILNNPASTDEQKAFARMQLEGLQDAPMRAEMLQQVDKINAARGAGMAGGGPIKRYQSVGSVESGRGDTPPGRIPVIAALERWGGRNIDRSQRLRELIEKIQYEQRVGFTEAKAQATAILDRGEGGGGGGGEGITGGQSQIDRPSWYEQLPVDQTAPEVGTQVSGPIPGPGGGGQEIGDVNGRSALEEVQWEAPAQAVSVVDTPVSPQLDPNLPVDPSAIAGLQALPYEQAEFNAPEQRFYDEAVGQAGRDPIAESRLIGERYRELTGMEDEMAARAKEFEGLQSLREEQFDPKESLLRRWKAGLAQGARQGLGGFGAGVGREEDKILAERLDVRESNVENMDKLISDLRALGLGQFQAEQEAQKMVGEFRSQGATDAQALLAGLRATNNALIQAATQIEVTRETGRWQEAIARIRNANNTDLMDKLEISARALRRDDPNLSYEEAMEQAYEIYKDDQLSLGFARIGVNKEAAADQRNIKVLLAAVEAVDGRDSFAQQQTGIMNPNGSINEDKYWDAVEIAAEKLGGLLKTLEGTTPTTTQAMDRVSEILGRTITNVSELTPAETIRLQEAGLLQGN